MDRLVNYLFRIIINCSFVMLCDPIFCLKLFVNMLTLLILGIDFEFEKLLIRIFGSEFIDAFRTKRPAGWVDLMVAFESRKRTANPFKNNPLNVSLPFSFIDYYKKFKVSQNGNTLFVLSLALNFKY